MTDYYVFLRGINVGGHHKIPMAELKKLLGDSGFKNVRTFLASGNVRLEGHDDNHAELEGTIGTILEDHFGFPVPVMARSANRMEQLFKENPYGAETEDKKIKWLVTFLKENAANHPRTDTTEGFRIIRREDDLVCGIIDLNITGSVDAMKVLEKGYGRNITSRTWQTLQKMNK